MSVRVCVSGVGMIPFSKPGASETYDVMAGAAVRAALHDAGIDYARIEQAYVGYVYGDSAYGQKSLYPIGMTGIPIFNVNNNCATGATALFLARQAIESRAADCVLALGFEQMTPGALDYMFNDRPRSLSRFEQLTDELLGSSNKLPFALRCFGGAGYEHMKRFGTKLETFAKIRAKASRHAAQNPLALFKKEVSADDVMAAETLWPGVMTRLMACPPTCGAAAAILCSEAFARKHGLSTEVQIRAQAMTTDYSAAFAAKDMRELVGASMAKSAAYQVYEKAGVGTEDIQVIELHDCFAHNELITYEALGLCAEGEAEKFVEDGDNTYGGNTSPTLREVFSPRGIHSAPPDWRSALNW